MRRSFHLAATAAAALVAAAAALAQPVDSVPRAVTTPPTRAAPPAKPASPAQAAPGTPANLEPIPEASGDTDLEPQVTITRRKGETREEARVNGKLVWIRVVPLHGRPYYLIPDGGEYTFIRRDSFDTGLKVPLWVLLTF